MESILNLRDSILRGDQTARSATDSALTAAEQLNVTLNAFLEINRTDALTRAAAVDEQIKSADESSTAAPALAGVPIAVKDNICVRGFQASCGSRILEPYHPPYDATVIDRLLAAGSVIIGKTNCHEFSMASS